jgi:hypothetical protein
MSRKSPRAAALAGRRGNEPKIVRLRDLGHIRHAADLVPDGRAPDEGVMGKSRGEAVMGTSGYSAGLGVVTLLALALAVTSANPASADSCELRMGPYGSQSAADTGVQQAKSVGYKTSSVWGEGGTVSQISNRRYFFNVFFSC